MRLSQFGGFVLVAGALLSCTPSIGDQDSTSTPKTATVTIATFDQYFYESEVGAWYNTDLAKINTDYTATIHSLQNLLSVGAITETEYAARVTTANSDKATAIAALDAKKYAEDHYGYADIDYTVTNTDTSTITSIKVYFKATTTDGSVFTSSCVSTDIPVGATKACSTVINTIKKKATSVEIVSYSAE